MQSFQQEEISNNREISPQFPQKPSHQKSIERPSLSPLLANYMIFSESGFVCYHQRQNMLIVASQNILVFYDTTTPDDISAQELDDYPSYMSYCDENYAYLIGCYLGCIYSSHASKNECKKLRKCKEDVFLVKFLSSKFYAFCLDGSKKLHIGNLENESTESFGWYDIKPNGLHYLTKNKLLFSGFDNGSVKIFNTKDLPHLKEFCTVQAHRNIFVLQSFEINGKEYVITGGEDKMLKIWHFIKGKMRLLKVIHTNRKTACSAVYLENYKMIAVGYDACYIDFFKMPSGKLERKVHLKNGYTERHELFLMKDKNMLGYVGSNVIGQHVFYLIQLHS